MNQEDIARGQDRKKKPAKGGTNNANTIYSYHPTKQHTADIAESGYSLETALGDIQRKLRDGCALSIGQSDRSPSVFVIVRDATAPFGAGPAVSVWHADLGRCLVGAGYYLSAVNPEFPDVAPTSLAYANDW